MAISKYLKPLYVQVIIGAVLGILVGHFFPDLGIDMKPLGDGFIKLLKMVVAPVIFTIIVIGIARMSDMKALGRVGLTTVLYFEIVTTAALFIGLVVAHIIEPGAGMNIDPSSLKADAVAGFAKTAESQHLVDFFLKIIPDTFVAAFVNGEILPVVFIAVLTGCALARAGRASEQLTVVIEQVSDLFFKMVSFLMYLAPIGAFGAMAFTTGKFGAASLIPYLKLMAAFYLTCAIFIFVVLGAISRYAGVSIWRLVVYLKDEIVIVLGAGSAEPALPRLLQKLERLGCDKTIVGLVAPTGYAFNIDGVCIYLTMAVVFLSQALNIELSLTQQIVILLIGSFTSKGMSGVPGGGFVALAATLASVGTIPLPAIGLLIGVDRFMGEARAVTSFIGNAVATVFVAQWEGKLDRAQARLVLAGKDAGTDMAAAESNETLSSRTI
ncbi:C4-dicarboxylate transporter DctA [Rhizobium multihospitium]|uniref:C4-dicarboxylate transport protein n=1 Tax=Rhizobium multihospitium TaxID=410764 RepID=A0A1C3U567_9HYPH|nr:C4-dicarboxylate transporter DctA [Rhizobium multihospitium]SCB10602.1 aerobic C4-dicarboxylate transport protein [Rhizobium multihospitium]